MSHKSIAGSVSVLTLIVATAPVYAQRGVGESVGVARQTPRPEVSRIEGQLTEVKTGPCELTTGHAGIGTHLILQTQEGTKFNLHLGPAGFVQPYVKTLEVGQTIAADAFKTEKLPTDHYVAVRLVIGAQTISLRDESLRPAWAGARRYGPRGSGQHGLYGHGRGGRGYGYRWSYEDGADVRPGLGRQAHGAGRHQFWAMAQL